MSNTQTTQIKHRFTGAVMFECDAPESLTSGLRVRHALGGFVVGHAERAPQERHNG